jgi:hypothetical protein
VEHNENCQEVDGFLNYVSILYCTFQVHQYSRLCLKYISRHLNSILMGSNLPFLLWRTDGLLIKIARIVIQNCGNTDDGIFYVLCIVSTYFEILLVLLSFEFEDISFPKFINKA